VAKNQTHRLLVLAIQTQMDKELTLNKAIDTEIRRCASALLVSIENNIMDESESPVDNEPLVYYRGIELEADDLKNILSL